MADAERAPAAGAPNRVCIECGAEFYGRGRKNVCFACVAAPAAGAQKPVAWLIENVEPSGGIRRRLKFDAASVPGAVRVTPLYAAPASEVAEPSGVELWHIAMPAGAWWTDPRAARWKPHRFGLICGVCNTVFGGPRPTCQCADANPGGTLWDGRSAHVGATLRNGDTLPSATVPVTQAVGEEDEAWLDSEASRLALEAQRHLHYERGGEGWFTARGVMLNNEAGRLRRILARLRGQAAELDRLRGNCDALLAAAREPAPASEAPR